MSTLGARIRKAREGIGMSQGELAIAIGIKPSSGVISNWERDLNKPDADKIVKLCEVLNISASFLLDYYGQSASGFRPSEIEFIKKYRSLDPLGKAAVDFTLEHETQRTQSLESLSEQADQLQAELSGATTPSRYFSYYGRVAAAGKSFGFEDIVAHATVMELPLTDLNRHADYLIGVSGDSMEPDYSDGDIVYVKKADHLNVGDVGIFQKDNGIYIKEVGEDGLISRNPAYKPMIDDSDVICLGKVIGKAEEG